MDHLYNSRVRVEQQTITSVDGIASATWAPVPGLSRVPCRLDLNFIRPGKDVLPAPEAGRAPDRYGVLFCASSVPLRAGYRVVAVPNDQGLIPERGTFDIRVVPDQAQGFAAPHHIEVQVVESAPNDNGNIWPGDTPL